MGKEGDQRPRQPQDHTLHHEGPLNKRVGGAAHLHDGDLLPAVECCQLDGVGDDEQGHHRQDADEHQGYAGGDVPHQHKALGNGNGRIYFRHAGHLLHQLGGLLHLLDVVHMDAIAIPQHRSRHGVQQIVVLPALQKLVQRLLPGDEGHLRHIGHRLDLALQGPCLLLRAAVIDIGQKFVFFLQVPQRVVQIHRQQGEGAHDQQTGHDHTHGGKGHKAVGKDGVEPLAEIISRIKLSRHCSTHLSRR